MEIKTKGNPDKIKEIKEKEKEKEYDYYREIECDHCDAGLSIEFKDVVVKSGCLVVKCPECEQYVDIHPRFIPPPRAEDIERITSEDTYYKELYNQMLLQRWQEMLKPIEPFIDEPKLNPFEITWVADIPPAKSTATLDSLTGANWQSTNGMNF